VEDRIQVTIDETGIATLAMRDEAGKNAFSRAFVDDLLEAFAFLGRSESAASAKVCVLTGLDEVFCAGGDRDLLLSLAQGGIAPYDLELTRALLELPIPTIAAMKGHAVGGGLVFGIACDVIVMSRESRYGCNFMDLGFTPGMGTTRLLQVAVGEHLAAEMMYGCQYFRGSHFEGRSGINYVEPVAKVEDRAWKVARRFTDKPRFALELLKRNLSLPRRQAFEEARATESMMHEICFANPETRERIRANYQQIGPGGTDDTGTTSETED
jgi:polyketide biosynthesis enoyl-CoA hydratase PksI